MQRKVFSLSLIIVGLSEESLAKLLEVTVVIISTNPIINSKSNHGSPWHELTNGIKSFCKLDVKAEAKVNASDLLKLV